MSDQWANANPSVRLRKVAPAPSAADLAATVRDTLLSVDERMALTPPGGSRAWPSREDALAANDALLLRAEAAEAELAEYKTGPAYQTVVDALRAAEAERDEAWNKLGGESMRCERAEARVAELEQALREAGRILDGWVLASDPASSIVSHAERVIDAALQSGGSDSR